MESLPHEAPQVRVHLSCRRLPAAYPNTYVELSTRPSQDARWTRVANTEVVYNTRNPEYMTYFLLDYHFGEMSEVRVKVWDAPENPEEPHRPELVGEARVALSEIVGCHGDQLIRDLESPMHDESRGNVIFFAVKSEKQQYEITLKFSGIDLKSNAGLFGRFKPFFFLSQSMENGSFLRGYRSEVQTGTNVTWESFTEGTHVICGEDFMKPLKLEVVHAKSNGEHKSVGEARFSLNEITEQGVRTLRLTDGKGKSVGKIRVDLAELRVTYSVLDYLMGGCQVSLITAVDFTKSNGEPQHPDSLHYLSPQSLNLYQQALKQVSEILLCYDSDKLVPMYGFGCKVGGRINHCFPLTFDPNNPYVEGIDGVMNVYANAVTAVEFSGPTMFSGIIKQAVLAAEGASVSQQNQEYYILLILTDGEISDEQATIDWIVRGSYAPLSLIIVGIGDADFTRMEVIDSDNELLVDSKGKEALRDIVQFVAFRDVRNSSTALSRQVLDELPREIENYFKLKDIAPNAPVQGMQGAPQFQQPMQYQQPMGHHMATVPPPQAPPGYYPSDPRTSMPPFPFK